MSETRPKKCSHCTQPATIHVTKVIGDQVLKLGVCAACPHAAKLKTGVAFDLIEGGEASVMQELPSESKVACPSCGLTPADFKEHGRLGCPQCYEVFSEKLSPLLLKLHGNSEHFGKAPHGRQRVISQEQIETLKRRLNEHVAREEYELAAVVRDQLKALGARE